MDHGDPAPPERGTAAPLFSAHVLWPNGRPSQLLLSTCSFYQKRSVALKYAKMRRSPDPALQSAGEGTLPPHIPPRSGATYTARRSRAFSAWRLELTRNNFRNVLAPLISTESTGHVCTVCRGVN